MMTRSRLRWSIAPALVALATCWLASTAFAQFNTQFGVRIPMRDGVHLTADVWVPAAAGPFPAILVRTPYMRNWDNPNQNFGRLGAFYTAHGYAFVVQDVRGRGDSEGEFDFFFQEAADGYDTVEWIARQPWSNGRVGMMGGSYLGTVQWLAARERPPHLVCIVPRAPAGRYFDEIPYHGGAFALEWALTWLNDTSGHTEQRANVVGMDLDSIFRHRPLISADIAMGRKMRLYREFLQHDTLDDYWKRIQFTASDFQKIAIPTLTITGWFDGDQAGALFYWRNIRAHSPRPDAHYLLVGPWTHSQTGSGGVTTLGHFTFSSDATYDPQMLHLAFFDRFLKQTADRFAFPRARVYVTGSNRWLELSDYPGQAIEHRALYMHSGGSANSLRGDGRLSWNAPDAESADSYVYDPSNPVRPKADEGPGADQRYIEGRQDVLIYTTDNLSQPITILGKVVLCLFAATDAADTDFTARLLDVDENGLSLPLGPGIGIIRARYRSGYDHPESVAPNKIAEYQIELFDIGHTFLPHHRIRIEISSSYAPEYDPNSNTGDTVAVDTGRRVAHQTIYHQRAAASKVVLPVFPN